MQYNVPYVPLMQRTAHKTKLIQRAAHLLFIFH